jgi:phytoene synthase
VIAGPEIAEGATLVFRAAPAVQAAAPVRPRPAAALAVMARHGRSFRLAGRLLPRGELDAAAELYAFCRTVDDLADESADAAQARRSLLGLLAALRGAGSHPLAERFRPLRLRGVPEDAAALLVETVIGDIGAVRIADEAGLLRYAHGAAGTVGVMMCAVLGATDEAARPYAIDLGVAIQLTNIARDVAADAAQDRLYLPAEWLPRGYAPQDVARRPDPAFAAVRRVLDRADRHYRSAERGYDRLPPRSRRAIRAAARLYEAIGPTVLRAGPGALVCGRRCVVPGWRRLALLAGCLLPSPPAGPHDAGLHAAFSACPGTPA